MNDNKIHIFNFLNYILLQRNYSKNTFDSYKHDIEDFLKYLNDKDLKTININDIANYFSKLKSDGINSRTIARRYSSLNSLFKYLIENKIIENSPLELFDYPKIKGSLPEYLEFEDVEKLLNSINGDTYNEIRDKALFEFMYSTGVRVSEVCNLKIENLNLEENFCFIYGKGKKERVVPFGDKAKTNLNIYLNKVRPIFNKKNLKYFFI